MQRDDPTGHRPGGPAPGGPGAGPDTVLAALAHRLRARSERQQLLTERLRSGELRPGALADLAELAAAARRGVRDGDHILVMAGAAEPDRSSGGGPVPMGQALSAAVAASEAASRTVVPPTPSVSLDPAAAPVFAQILAELLAHATAATAPGERLELHTRWGPDGGLVLELLSPRPVPTRTPVEDLDRMLAAGRPDGPVAPQEIGLYLAARLARAIGGRLGLRGSPGVASAPGPSPVAVLQLPPSVLAGSRSAGDDADRTGAPSAADPLGPATGADPLGTPDDVAAEDAVTVGDPPTNVVAAAPSPPSAPSTPSAPSVPAVAQSQSDPEPSVPPWPPVPAAETGPNGPPSHGVPSNGLVAGSANGPSSNGLSSNDPASNGVTPDAGSSGEQDVPSGPGIARLPVPPPPPSVPPGPPQAPPPPDRPQFPFPPAAHSGPPPGPSGAGLQIPPGPRGPGGPPPSGPGPGPGPNQPGPHQSGPGQPGPPPGANQPGPAQPGPNRQGFLGGAPAGPNQSGPGRPVDAPPPTEALPVSGTTPPVELFGPFDSEVPVPVDDLDGTPIFAAVASAWFRDPNATPNATPNGASGGPGTNGHRPGDEPANWSSAGDAEFEAARNRADRVVEPPVNAANGLPMRRPGQQMVPPARRDNPPAAQRTPGTSERQPDRVRNRLASYQRGLREGRHRAAEESSNPPAGADLNGAAGHGHNGHAAG